MIWNRSRGSMFSSAVRIACFTRFRGEPPMDPDWSTKNTSSLAVELSSPGMAGGWISTKKCPSVSSPSASTVAELCSCRVFQRSTKSRLGITPSGLRLTETGPCQIDSASFLPSVRKQWVGLSNAWTGKPASSFTFMVSFWGGAMPVGSRGAPILPMSGTFPGGQKRGPTTVGKANSVQPSACTSGTTSSMSTPMVSPGMMLDTDWVKMSSRCCSRSDACLPRREASS